MALNIRTAPVLYPEAQGFGTWSAWRQQNGLSWHAATDWGAPLGTPMLAPDAGEVIYADALQTPPGDLGYVTIVDHGDYGLLLAHQDKPHPELLGLVNRGDVMGYVGNTGMSTGPHVHAIMSAKKHGNGWWDFARDTGNSVDARLWWDSRGYNDDLVLDRLFHSHPMKPGGIWSAVTKRIVTKRELFLLRRVGVSQVWIQGMKDWTSLNTTAPEWTSAMFPPVIPKMTALMVTRQSEGAI